MKLFAGAAFTGLLVAAAFAVAPVQAAPAAPTTEFAQVPDDLLAQFPPRRGRPVIVNRGRPVLVQPRRRNNAGAVAAGVAAGLVGAAIIGGALSQPRQPQQVYVDEWGRPVQAVPRRRVVVQDEYADEVVVQPRCWNQQVPVVDQWGQVVAYRNRRVCQ